MWPPFPGPPTARWRWPRLTRSSARRPKSATSASSRCCCSTSRPRSVPSRRWRRPVSSNSWWRPTRMGNARGGPPRSCTPRRMRTSHLRRTWPPCWPRTRAAWKGPSCGNRFDARGVQFGPAFTGLAAAHTAEGTAGTVLAEVGLPGSIRSQQAAYGVHPALLDACFQSVAAHPAVQGAGSGGLLLPLGVRRLRAYGPARNARYCYARVTRADAAAVRGRPRRPGRARDSPADCAWAADRHRGLREQQPRSRAGRAAADHRMAAASAARGRPRRRRNMAADQHLRYRGSRWQPS